MLAACLTCLGEAWSRGGKFEEDRYTFDPHKVCGLAGDIDKEVAISQRVRV